MDAAPRMIKTIKAGGFSMDYFKFGHGNEPLVILPGLSVQSVMLSKDAIEEEYKDIADDFTMYVFDRRKDIPPGYDNAYMARDTAEAILAAGLTHVNIFGASQGAMIAMVIASEYPELIDKLVLSSTTPVITDEDFVIFEKWIRIAEDGDAEKLYLTFGEDLYPESIFDASKKLLMDTAKTVTKEELERFVMLAETNRGFDCKKKLENVGCPVLIFADKTDRVFGERGAKVIERILKSNAEKCPRLETEVYDGYGHALYDTAPGFRGRMREFLLEK